MASSTYTPSTLASPDTSPLVAFTHSSGTKGGPKFRKTSTGCWTCRTRHLKCGEEKPACSRCLRASLTCQGYAVRLTWCSPREFTYRPSRPASSADYCFSSTYQGRGSVSRDNVPALNPSQLRKHLVDIDNHAIHSQETQRGPFSVFPVAPATNLNYHAQEHSIPSQSVQDTPEGSTELLQFSPGNDMSNDSLSVGHGTRQAREEYAIENNSDLAAKIMMGSNYSTNPMCFGFDETTSDGQNQTADSPNTGSIPAISKKTNKPFRRSVIRRSTETSFQLSFTDPVPQLAQDRELIHHWVTFLCGNMVAIDGIHNMYRSIFTPAAYAGFVAEGRKFAAQKAVYHSICSAAAYSLCKLKSYDGYYPLRALRHEQIAMEHMRIAMEKSGINDDDNEEESFSLHIAILACLVSEAVTGRAGRWKIHLTGGFNILRNVRRLKSSAQSSSLIIRSYLVSCALGNIQIPDDVWSRLDKISAKSNAFSEMSGLTDVMVDKIARINNMRQHLHSLGPEEVAELEVELYLQTPTHSNGKLGDTPAAQIVNHYEHVWYYAILVYFQRSIRGATTSAVQVFVEKALDHMEAVEQIGQDKHGCLLIWPWLVVTSECDAPQLRKKALVFFGQRQRHGFGNVEQSICTILETWRRRDMHPDNNRLLWQDLSEEPRYSFLPW